MELYAFFDLLSDAFLRLAVGGVESSIAAKSTASRADFSIAIGTTKARVNADFLHPSTKLLREVVVVAVETPIISPGVVHGLE